MTVAAVPGEGHTEIEGPAPAPAEPVRVHLVDDQELVRYGLRLVLESVPELIVVGESADGAQAVRDVQRLKPNVVLMDVRMPGMNGIEATRQIMAAAPETRVLVLTTYDIDDAAFGALDAGAAGFLLKDTRPPALIAAVLAVAAGDAVVSPRVTAKLIEIAAPHLQVQRPGGSDDALASLTPRECEIFVLIGRGQTNQEIAASLHLSESTVKAHVGRLMQKLGLRNRVESVIRAYELGLVTA